MAEVGSVFVSVIPSMRGFATKVRAELKGLGDVKMGVDLDTGKAKTEAAAARKEMGGDVKFKVDLDTKKAVQSIRDLKTVMGSLALPAGIVAATPYLLSLGASAVQAAGGLALLPAGILGAGVAILGLKAAAGGVGKAIKDAFDPTAAKALKKDLEKLPAPARAFVLEIQKLSGGFMALREAASGALFNGLAASIQSLATLYLPLVMSAFVGIAGAVNGAALSVAGWLRSSSGIAAVNTIVNYSVVTFRNLMAAVAPLATAFVTIGAIGAPILAQLSANAGAVAGRFAAWVGSAQGIQTITGWIWGAIGVIRQLWTIAMNVGSILGSLFTAGAASGQSFLDILVQVTGWLANALRAPEGAAILTGVLAGIRDIVGLLWQKLVILWPAISALGGAFFALLQAAAPITLLLANVLSPVLTMIGLGLQALAPIIGPLIGLWMAWNVVLGIWDLLMSANPITLVVLALALLVGAVIYAYQNFTWFRDIVNAVGAAFVWLWQSVIVPAWTAIAAAFTWAWTTILQPIFSAIGTVLAYLGVAILTLLVAPFVIAWNIISALVMAVWTTVLSPIWYGAIAPALQFLGSVFTWLWTNAVVPAWNGISNAISISWAFVSGIFSAIRNYLSGVLGPIFQWLYSNVIAPVWNAISNTIAGAWNFIQGVFDVGKRAVQAVGQAFQNVADWIARAWDSIREATRRPVQFVVDVVYNNGIRPVWNGIAGLFGMAQLGPVRMATGGVLPGYTPGRDVIPAMLSGGEGILVPEAVRGLGPAFVGWANRHFSGGRSDGGPGTSGGRRGFSRGGVAHYAGGGIVDTLLNGGSAMMEFLTNLFTDAAGAVKQLFASVIGDNKNVPGGGHPWTEALKGVVPKTIDAVIAKAKEWVESIGSMGGAGNWAGVASAALAMAGQSLKWLPNVLAQIQIESGGNPRAINLWDSNARKGTPSMGLLQTILPTFNAYAGVLRGLGPFNPLANIYAAVRYTIARYGSLAKWPTRGGYANGGVVPGSGSTDSVHAMLTPGERVLTRAQTRAFDALVANMSRRGQNLGPGAWDGMGQAGSAPVIGTVVQQLPDGASSRHFAEELSFEMRRNGLVRGVHA